MAGTVLWRHVGKLAAIFALMVTPAEGVSYVVSTCKEFEAIPTPMHDDTHIVITKDIACRSVSNAPTLSFFFLLRLSIVVYRRKEGGKKAKSKKSKANRNSKHKVPTYLFCVLCVLSSH